VAGKAEQKPLRKWHSNVVQNDYGLLVVSQFTLYSFMKGNKPDFHKAMDGEKAKVLYEQFVGILRKGYKPDKVQTGAFGQMMEVEIVNDGPVTLIWE